MQHAERLQENMHLKMISNYAALLIIIYLYLTTICLNFIVDSVLLLVQYLTKLRSFYYDLFSN